MPVVSPKLSTPPSADMRRRLVDAGDAQNRAAAYLRATVLEAMADGVSIREVSVLADLSTNTVQRWKKEAGLMNAPIRQEIEDCAEPNPSWPEDPSRCTQPFGHDGPHISVGHSQTLTWEGEQR